MAGGLGEGVMLHLYRRHRTSCRHRSWTYRRCQCPIYVKGSLGGQTIKESLDQTDWNAASAIVGDWIKAGKIGPRHNLTDQTIEDVVTLYVADVDTRELTAATRKKYAVLLSKRLVSWAESTGIRLVAELTPAALTAFRATWPDAPLAKQKNQERLKAFCRWCVSQGYLSANPAEGLSPVKVRPSPTLPFSTEEMDRILAACDCYPTQNAYGYDNRARLRAFVLVLRWSGLRIGDVTGLARDAVKDGALRLYTHKTGTPVHVPLPPACLDALAGLPESGLYYFWSGKGQLDSAVSNWQRALRTLFALATVENGHAHRFRDTFAVELLMAGVDLSDVSTLLGHASVKVTEKHYAPWIAARQHRLEHAVRAVWGGADTATSAPATAAAPGQPPIAECATPGPDAARPARTETDDAHAARTRPTLLRFPAGRSGVRAQEPRTEHLA